MDNVRDGHEHNHGLKTAVVGRNNQKGSSRFARRQRFKQGKIKGNITSQTTGMSIDYIFSSLYGRF